MTGTPTVPSECTSRAFQDLGVFTGAIARDDSTLTPVAHRGERTHCPELPVAKVGRGGSHSEPLTLHHDTSRASGAHGLERHSVRGVRTQLSVSVTGPAGAATTSKSETFSAAKSVGPI